MLENEMLDKLNDFVIKIQSAKKKAEKAATLLSALKDDDLETFLKFALNPRVVTGISDSKIHKPVTKNPDDYYPNSLFMIMYYLAKHNTGSDSEVALIQAYIERHEDHRDLLERIFTKNLPLGVEAKTVNKVFGYEFIPDWQVSQGNRFDNLRLKDGEWFSLSQKLNGNRGTFYNGQFISRQGSIFGGLEHIAAEIGRLHKFLHDDYVLDGELIRKNVDGLPDSENFTIGTGLLNSDSADKSAIEFVVFDIVPKAEFDSSEGETTYRDRLILLDTLENHIEFIGLQNIRVVTRVYQGNDKSAIDQWLEYAETHDWEGLMLNKDVPYFRKRHSGLIKIKKFYSMDLPVIGFEEGANRLSGTLGALIVDFKGNEVRVGSGFDDALRAQIWSNQSDYLGKLVSVKYKEITKDKTTKLESLQFPIFERFRDDKSEVSYD